MGRMIAAFGVGLLGAAALELTFVPAVATATVLAVATGMAPRPTR